MTELSEKETGVLMAFLDAGGHNTYRAMLEERGPGAIVLRMNRIAHMRDITLVAGEFISKRSFPPGHDLLPEIDEAYAEQDALFLIFQYGNEARVVFGYPTYNLTLGQWDFAVLKIGTGTKG